MALRLNELQNRVKAKGHNTRRPSPHSIRARTHSAPALAGGHDLKSQLVAKGASPDEAERIVNLVAQADAAGAMTYGRALSTPVPLPSVTVASGAAQSAILSALRFTSIGVILDGIFALCDEFDIAISLGLGFLSGVGIGGGQTVGIVFGPGRTIGYFSSVGQVVGWIISVSGSISFSVVKGGMSAFNGQSVTVGFTMGVENPAEPVSPGVGVHNIYNTNGDWIGMTGEISLSAGMSPIEVFRGEWTTRSQTTRVPALSISGQTHRSFSSEPIVPATSEDLDDEDTNAEVWTDEALAGHAGALTTTTTLQYTNQNAIRDKPCTKNMEERLVEAVNAVYGAGCKIEIYSGGQDRKGHGTKRTGSIRHDDYGDGGRAADCYIYNQSGSKITGVELAKVGQHWLASNFGCVGHMMRGSGIHLDEWVTPPPGGGRFWLYEPTRTAPWKDDVLRMLRAGANGTHP